MFLKKRQWKEHLLFFVTFQQHTKQSKETVSFITEIISSSYLDLEPLKCTHQGFAVLLHAYCTVESLIFIQGVTKEHD